MGAWAGSLVRFWKNWNPLVACSDLFCWRVRTALPWQQDRGLQTASNRHFYFTRPEPGMERRGGWREEEELYLQSSTVAATCPPELAGSLNICNKMHKHDNKWNDIQIQSAGCLTYLGARSVLITNSLTKYNDHFIRWNWIPKCRRW